MIDKKYYTQGEEEKYITEYFYMDQAPAAENRMLLSIGENDGRTFSNALRLIEQGWNAILVEPSPTAFAKLQELHKDNTRVLCMECAIGDKDDEQATFFDSGTHLGEGDTSLLSTLDEKELDRWHGSRNEFNARKVREYTWDSFTQLLTGLPFNPGLEFDFISIDAEGMDIIILKQMDLSKCKMLCIEWNSKQDVKLEIMNYCAQYGLIRLQFQNGENLIIVR